MKPNVPPDFLGVVDATSLHQELAIIFVLGERFERVRNSSSRETLEHFQTVAFQSSILSDPKRRVDRESVNVRQEIAGLIHHVDRRLAIRNSHVDVQSENEIRARERLHIFQYLLVTLTFGDELVAPMREGMRSDRRNF